MCAIIVPILTLVIGVGVGFVLAVWIEEAVD